MRAIELCLLLLWALTVRAEHAGPGISTRRSEAEKPPEKVEKADEAAEAYRRIIEGAKNEPLSPAQTLRANLYFVRAHELRVTQDLAELKAQGKCDAEWVAVATKKLAAEKQSLRKLYSGASAAIKKTPPTKVFRTLDDFEDYAVKQPEIANLHKFQSRPFQTEGATPSQGPSPAKDSMGSAAAAVSKSKSKSSGGDFSVDSGSLPSSMDSLQPRLVLGEQYDVADVLQRAESIAEKTTPLSEREMERALTLLGRFGNERFQKAFLQESSSELKPIENIDLTEDRYTAKDDWKKIPVKERRTRLQLTQARLLQLLHDAGVFSGLYRTDRSNSVPLATFLADVPTFRRSRQANDLSCRYQSPRSQGSTFACGPFAVTSDAELKLGERLSPRAAYLAVGADEKGMSINGLLSTVTPQTRAEMNQQLDNGVRSLSHLMKAISKNGLAPEASAPFKDRQLLPLSGAKIPNLKYTLIHYKTVEVGEGGVASDELRALVDAGQPPIVSISTDARTIREDWIRLEPTGNFGHMINVVGYGQAVDPFSLKNEGFFVVRDSFTDGERHYRVKASELAATVTELGKVLTIGVK